MLGKLLKHETKATARIFLPVYGATIAVAIFTRLMMLFQSNASEISAIEIILSLSVLLFAVLIGASGVLTLVVMISRFHKNLLGEQGYLMLTLPAKPWQHIVSKLLVSTLWMFGSSIVAIISFIILMSYQGIIGMLLRGFGEVWHYIATKMDLNSAAFVIEFLILMIAFIAISSLMIYFAIALGHRSNKNRVAAGFGWYIAICIVMQTLTTVLTRIFPWEVLFASFSAPSLLHTSMWITIAFVTLISAFFFWGTSKILTTKLNLE